MAADIKFGTDGWRGVIAWDFTYENVRRLAENKYFTVRQISVDPLFKGSVDEECFLSLTCIKGDGVLVWGEEELKIERGDTYFLPAGLGEFSLRGEMKLISARV